MSEPFEFMPEDWSTFEKELYQDAFGDVFYSDRMAEALYHEAFFNFNMGEGGITELRDNLRGYLMDEYGIDFDEQFDWDSWRDAYEGET